MWETSGNQKTPLLESQPQTPNAPTKRTGNLWTAVAHIVTGVVGSGVLSLAWSLAQLGWIAGPLAIILFALVALTSAFLLCDCYRSPDPEHGPSRHPSYFEAVYTKLGVRKARLCNIFVQVSLYGMTIAYTVTSGISMRAIQISNCYHSLGHQAACNYGDTVYMLIFGVLQILLSQIPDIHNMHWLSIVAAIMSFSYSGIGLGLGIARVIDNGSIRGSIYGIPTSAAEKVWLVAQALGDIAFAYPYSAILIEIQDTLKSPPPENETMKKASILSIAITTFFYLCCGGFGYAAFGNATPGNLLTGFGFYEPYWLVDFANTCIVLHLFGGYQLYAQPLFANVEKWFAYKYPNSGFVNKNYTVRLPFLPVFTLNLLRLCFRTLYVVSTTVISMIFPYFNQVLGVMGAIYFWPSIIYFPVEMYLKQRNIEAWTARWMVFRIFNFVCLLVTLFALVGSIEGLISARLGTES